MSRVVAGTLLLPNGQPMANASIYFTAKRTEPVSIIEGSNTFFTTNNAGVYNQTVVNGWYAVSIEYIADSSGAHTRRWSLGDVFIEDGAASTLEALIIASNPPSDLPLALFYEILADAQQAAADAQAAAIAAAASAASIAVGTGPTNIPNTTILNSRLGTSGNLGTMAQQNSSSVMVTGGTINGATIGAATRASGKFTDVESTGNISTSNGRLLINSGDSPWGVFRSGNDTADYLSLLRSSDGAAIAYIGGGNGGAASGFNDDDLVLNSPTGRVIFVSGDSDIRLFGRTAVTGNIYASGGYEFPSFTVATVPAASANTNVGIIVSNAASGRRPYWSNGTDWRDASNTILS